MGRRNLFINFDVAALAICILVTKVFPQIFYSIDENGGMPRSQTKRNILELCCKLDPWFYWFLLLSNKLYNLVA